VPQVDAAHFDGQVGGHVGGLPHRRDVRWHGEVPRAAVRPTAQLQDPRALFQVRLSASAAALPGPRAG
jgi:hypothetical protein